MADDDKPRWMVTRKTVEEVFAAGVPLHFINANTLSLGGYPVEIGVDPDTLTEETMLICAPVTLPLFPGSVVAACERCAAPITHRQNAPIKPKRVCWPCAKREGAFNV